MAVNTFLRNMSLQEALPVDKECSDEVYQFVSLIVYLKETI